MSVCPVGKRSLFEGSSRTHGRKRGMALLAAGLLTFFPMAEASEVTEHALKAAFIYNFAKFVEWPPRPDGLLHLCIVGDEMFDGELEKLQGKAVGSLRMQVEFSSWPDLPSSCQILYLSESESENLTQILRVFKGRSVLTIGDAKGFLDRGVMIELSLDGGRMSFEVNMAAARKGNMQISSKLLRLAKRVNPP